MKPTTTFLLMITLTASLALARAMEPDPDRPCPKLKAHDAITLSIHETREIKKFLDSILNITHQAPDLKRCVGRLDYDLDAMQSTLHQMRHLKHTNVPADVKSLKKYMAHGVILGKSCHNSFKNVDEIVSTMLTGKLDGLSMVINTVVCHVSSMEGDVYRVDTNVNPEENA